MKKETPIIELSCSDEYAPLPAVRIELRRALMQMGWAPTWSEYYQGWSNVPAHLKDLSRPSILVNHRIVWQGGNIPGSEVPNAADIRAILMQPPRLRRTIRWKKIMKTNASFLMAVLIAFFPKCPFCWAAYMSMFSFLGLNTMAYQPWLLPVFIVLFFANILSLYYNRKRHGYKLLLLSLAGALLIVLNRVFWNEPVAVYSGAALLVTASLWNSLSGRMINSIRWYFSLRTGH